MDDIIQRLNAACVGQPAHIPWPHRLLHDAREEFERLRAERDHWFPKDGPCFLCGEPTESLSGNPSKWPITLPYHYGNGDTRLYHQYCVVFLMQGNATMMEKIEILEAEREALWVEAWRQCGAHLSPHIMGARDLFKGQMLPVLEAEARRRWKEREK